MRFYSVICFFVFFVLILLFIFKSSYENPIFIASYFGYGEAFTSSILSHTFSGTCDATFHFLSLSNAISSRPIYLYTSKVLKIMNCFDNKYGIFTVVWPQCTNANNIISDLQCCFIGSIIGKIELTVVCEGTFG